ncbi:small ribosomal subunit protein uS2m [Diutina catenulata]
MTVVRRASRVATILRHQVRLASTVAETGEAPQETAAARERAVADALAREEQAAAERKRMRELKQHTVEQIHVLNKMPSALAAERMAKLQAQLDNLPQEKVKQLDAELEEFMSEQMALPVKEIINRPWAAHLLTADGKRFDDHTSSIGSTTSFAEFPNLKPTADYKGYSEQELYLRHLAHQRHTAGLGSRLHDVYQPRRDATRPDTISDITVAKLLAAGVHLGHARSSWRPTTQRFIYGEYKGVQIIDLNETMVALKRAANVIQTVARKGGVILYVGTGKLNFHQHRVLEEAAARSHGYYIAKRWIPGTITNFVEVTKHTAEAGVDGEASRVEVDMGDRPTGRQITDTSSLIKPDLVVLLNPVENRNCIDECTKARVPTIGLCDTNMEPSLLTYPIPANDDSVRSQALITGVLSQAAAAGVASRVASFDAYKKRDERPQPSM